MPESNLLDLSVEDVTETAWETLVRDMTGGADGAFPGFSISCSCSCHSRCDCASFFCECHPPKNCQ
jgi:hypothetical protein